MSNTKDKGKMYQEVKCWMARNIVFNKISWLGPLGPEHQRLSNIFVASREKLLTTIKELKWISLAFTVKISTEMRQN